MLIHALSVKLVSSPEKREFMFDGRRTGFLNIWTFRGSSHDFSLLETSMCHFFSDEFKTFGSFENISLEFTDDSGDFWAIQKNYAKEKFFSKQNGRGEYELESIMSFWRDILRLESVDLEWTEPYKVPSFIVDCKNHKVFRKEMVLKKKADHFCDIAADLEKEILKYLPSAEAWVKDVWLDHLPEMALLCCQFERIGEKLEGAKGDLKKVKYFRPDFLKNLSRQLELLDALAIWLKEEPFSDISALRKEHGQLEKLMQQKFHKKDPELMKHLLATPLEKVIEAVYTRVRASIAKERFEMSEGNLQSHEKHIAPLIKEVTSKQADIKRIQKNIEHHQLLSGELNKQGATWLDRFKAMQKKEEVSPKNTLTHMVETLCLGLLEGQEKILATESAFVEVIKGINQDLEKEWQGLEVEWKETLIRLKLSMDQIGLESFMRTFVDSVEYFYLYDERKILEKKLSFYKVWEDRLWDLLAAYGVEAKTQKIIERGDSGALIMEVRTTLAQREQKKKQFEFLLDKVFDAEKNYSEERFLLKERERILLDWNNLLRLRGVSLPPIHSEETKRVLKLLMRLSAVQAKEVDETFSFMDPRFRRTPIVLWRGMGTSEGGSDLYLDLLSGWRGDGMQIIYFDQCPEINEYGRALSVEAKKPSERTQPERVQGAASKLLAPEMYSAKVKSVVDILNGKSP